MYATCYAWYLPACIAYVGRHMGGAPDGFDGSFTSIAVTMGCCCCCCCCLGAGDASSRYTLYLKEGKQTKMSQQAPDVHTSTLTCTHTRARQLTPM